MKRRCNGWQVALKLAERVKDLGLYVWGLGVPVYFVAFEVLRLFVHVDAHLCRAMYAYLLKFFIIAVATSLPHYMFSQYIHNSRSHSPRLVMAACFAVIAACHHFTKPGTTSGIFPEAPRNFRFFPFFMVSCLAPPILLRTFGHLAPAKFTIFVFVLLNMCRSPSPPPPH